MVLCDEGQEDPFGLVHRAGPGSGQVGSAVSRIGSAWVRPGAGSECTHSPGSLVLDARRESKCAHIMAEGRRREPPSRDGLSAPPFHHRPFGIASVHNKRQAQAGTTRTKKGLGDNDAMRRWREACLVSSLRLLEVGCAISIPAQIRPVTFALAVPLFLCGTVRWLD